MSHAASFSHYEILMCYKGHLKGLKGLREAICRKSLYDIFKTTQDEFLHSCHSHFNTTVLLIDSKLSL